MGFSPRLSWLGLRREFGKLFHVAANPEEEGE